jgi:hypothetical protein
MSLAALITPANSKSASYRDTFERRSCVEDRELADWSFIAILPEDSSVELPSVSRIRASIHENTMGLDTVAPQEKRLGIGRQLETRVGGSGWAEIRG